MTGRAARQRSSVNLAIGPIVAGPAYPCPLCANRAIRWATLLRQSIQSRRDLFNHVRADPGHPRSDIALCRLSARVERAFLARAAIQQLTSQQDETVHDHIEGVASCGVECR